MRVNTFLRFEVLLLRHDFPHCHANGLRVSSRLRRRSIASVLVPHDCTQLYAGCEPTVLRFKVHPTLPRLRRTSLYHSHPNGSIPFSFHSFTINLKVSNGFLEFEIISLNSLKPSYSSSVAQSHLPSSLVFPSQIKVSLVFSFWIRQ